MSFFSESFEEVSRAFSDERALKLRFDRGSEFSSGEPFAPRENAVFLLFLPSYYWAQRMPTMATGMGLHLSAGAANILMRVFGPLTGIGLAEPTWP